MTPLEQLRQWLVTFPQWNEGELTVDHTEAQPCNSGLFVQGMEELERKQDITGNIRVRNRCSFSLHRVAGADMQENARWLLQLQQWIQQQSLLGIAPSVGQDQIIRAEKGSLSRTDPGGAAEYKVNITVDFTQVHEVM